MKFLKFYHILISLALISLFFTACDETTTTPDEPVPQPPTNLRATTLDSSTIKIAWNHSPSKDTSIFMGYVLEITPGTFQPINISKDQNTYTIRNLNEGTIYTFKLYAKFTNGKESATPATVQWSPATRFTTNVNDQPIRIYEYASSFGSGLNIFDETGGKPKTLTVANKNKWNVGIDTRNNRLIFASADKITFGTGTPEAPAEIGDKYWETNSLNDIYDSQALNVGVNFQSRELDLNQLDLDPEKGVAFILRIKRGTNYYYAKILIKRAASGELLQGVPDNRYIECEISYQKVANVPYAK